MPMCMRKSTGPTACSHFIWSDPLRYISGAVSHHLWASSVETVWRPFQPVRTPFVVSLAIRRGDGCGHGHRFSLAQFAGGDPYRIAAWPEVVFELGVRRKRRSSSA